MVVSTGVGGGLVLDGAPYDGRTGNAGHVGHVVVDPDGETVHMRWSWLRRDDRRGTANGAMGPRERLGRAPDADAKELADAAIGGSQIALQAFRRGATAVAA